MITEESRADRALAVSGLTPDDIGAAVHGYVTAQLWTTQDVHLSDGTTLDDGRMMDERLGMSDVAREYVLMVKADILAMIVRHPLAVRMYGDMRAYDVGDGTVWEHFGHDVFLTREGHGTGLWDRRYVRPNGTLDTGIGDYLTRAAEKLGPAGYIEDFTPPRPA